MFFRKIVFMVGGRALAETSGMLPTEGREIRMEDALAGKLVRYRVDKIIELYGNSGAHTSIEAQFLLGGPAQVIPQYAEIHLEIIE